MINNNKIAKLAILITTVEFVVLTAVAFFSIFFLMRSYSQTYAKSLVNQAKEAVSVEMSNPIIIGAAFSANPELVDLLQNENKLSDEEYISTASEMMRNFEKSVGSEYKVYLISESSKKYVTSDGLNKIIDIENDEHDIWYSIFLSQSKKYNIDIDTDQSMNDSWTAFVNYRIENETKELLGCLAIAYKITNVQESFRNLEYKYGISIDVFDENRNIILNSQNLDVRNSMYDVSSVEDIFGESFSMKGIGFVTTSFIDDLGWGIRIEDKNVVLLEAVKNMILVFVFVYLAVLLVILTITYKVLRHQSDVLLNDANMEGLISLSTIYHSMHLVDLEKRSYVPLKASENLLKIDGLLTSKGVTDINERFSYMMRESCKDEKAFKEIEEFINIDNIFDKLINLSHISKEFLGRDGRWFRASYIVKNRKPDGSPRSLIFATEDIDAQKKYEAELKKKSETDLLTGIYNRGYGESLISEYLMKKQPGMLLLMDADKFKMINDTYGHEVGDEVIISIANTIKNNVKSIDVVMRLGGDEFAAFIIGVDEMYIAKKVVNRVIDRISAIRINALGDKQLEISMGALVYAGNKRVQFEDMYKTVDKLLYASKEYPGSMCNYDIIE